MGALREPSFLLFSIALLLNYVAFYIPAFYVPIYGMLALGESRSFALECLVYVSVRSFVGRTLPMLAANRFGSLQVYIAATVGTVVVIFSWIVVYNAAGFIAFYVMYSIVSGVQVAAPSAAVSHPVLSPTMGVTGTRMGMVWMFASFGVLIRAPIAGSIVRLTPGEVDFTPLQTFTGAFGAGTVICLTVPFIVILKYDKANK